MIGDGLRLRVTDTQKKAGDVFQPSVVVEEGTVGTGAALTLEVDHARRTSDPAKSYGHPSSCTKRCAKSSAITLPRRVRWLLPTGSASISRIPSR